MHVARFEGRRANVASEQSRNCRHQMIGSASLRQEPVSAAICWDMNYHKTVRHETFRKHYLSGSPSHEPGAPAPIGALAAHGSTQCCNATAPITLPVHPQGQ